MPLATFHHMGVTVTDLDRSVAFYSSLFDLEEFARVEMTGDKFDQNLELSDAHVHIALLHAANSIVEFISYVNPADGRPYALRNCDIGASHSCFTVDDIDEFERKLNNAGYQLTGPPNDPLPDGPAKGSRFAYFKDPDGLIIEVLQPGAGIAA
jgi:catechol 2,3-dioxygenase-like lactoylglutathione lyase family enzyme